MPNDIKKLRRLMSVANMLKQSQVAVLRGKQPSASQALKYAWWFEEFRAKLSAGKYRFSYFKTDGSIREAIGTLNPEYIPSDKQPVADNPSPITPHYGTFPYFDLGRNSWRSFRLDNFIGFVEEMA